MKVEHIERGRALVEERERLFLMRDRAGEGGFLCIPGLPADHPPGSVIRIPLDSKSVIGVIEGLITANGAAMIAIGLSDIPLWQPKPVPEAAPK